MCRHCDNGGCPGCAWTCRCGHSCFRCQIRSMTSCRDINFAETLRPFREKYVCLHCHLIWKDKYTKSQKNDLWLAARHQGRDFDGFDGPRCRKCREFAERAGPAFNGCASPAEWKQLKEDCKAGRVNLYLDFHYCPSNSRDTTVFEPCDGRSPVEGIRFVKKDISGFTEEEQAVIRRTYVVD